MLPNPFFVVDFLTAMDFSSHVDTQGRAFYIKKMPPQETFRFFVHDDVKEFHLTVYKTYDASNPRLAPLHTTLAFQNNAKIHTYYDSNMNALLTINDQQAPALEQDLHQNVSDSYIETFYQEFSAQKNKRLQDIEKAEKTFTESLGKFEKATSEEMFHSWKQTCLQQLNHICRLCQNIYSEPQYFILEHQKKVLQEKQPRPQSPSPLVGGPASPLVTSSSPHAPPSLLQPALPVSSAPTNLLMRSSEEWGRMIAEICKQDPSEALFENIKKRSEEAIECENIDAYLELKKICKTIFLKKILEKKSFALLTCLKEFIELEPHTQDIFDALGDNTEQLDHTANALPRLLFHRFFHNNSKKENLQVYLFARGLYRCFVHSLQNKKFFRANFILLGAKVAIASFQITHPVQAKHCPIYLQAIKQQMQKACEPYAQTYRDDAASRFFNQLTDKQKRLWCPQAHENITHLLELLLQKICANNEVRKELNPFLQTLVLQAMPIIYDQMMLIESSQSNTRVQLYKWKGWGDEMCLYFGYQKTIEKISQLTQNQLCFLDAIFPIMANLCHAYIRIITEQRVGIEYQKSFKKLTKAIFGIEI